MAAAPLWLKRLKIPVNVVLIDNGEAWERYVKRFRSNSEAAEQFIADEKLVGNEDQRRGLKKKNGLISANDSEGLGTLSDEPLEHNNKNLRIYRAFS